LLYISLPESSDELVKGTGKIVAYVQLLYKEVSDVTKDTFSKTEQHENKQLLTH
jgi:hypothetical protein